MVTNTLRWRRQFLVTRTDVPELSSWRCFRCGEYRVYGHPDLACAAVANERHELILLGAIFDPREPRQDNGRILQDISDAVRTFRDLVIALKPYAGRYAVLFRDSQGLKVIQDPLSLREVYYCTERNAVVCGSQPGLVRRFSNPALEPTTDPEALRFYHHDMKKVRNRCLWVGDGTLFAGIKHLLPNHYFDARTRVAQRYWPNEPWRPLALDETVDRACRFLQGGLKALAHRHKIMIAVTSGTDSRTLLAASREIRDDVYYFVNKEAPLTDQSRDIRVPTQMCAGVGVPFHVHEIRGEVDPEFRQIFLDNAFFASDRILSTIYNVYFKQHADKVNVLGVGEIGRALWGTAPADVDGYFLAHTLRYRRSSYATRECARWLAEVQPLARSYGIDLLTLLLWEQLLGNWGVVGNSESDIAIEEIDPYDSHYMYETLLAIDQQAIHGDRHLVFHEMIRTMWPALLDYPFNPPDTPREKMKNISGRVGVFPIVKRLRYNWERHQYQRDQRRGDPSTSVATS